MVSTLASTQMHSDTETDTDSEAYVDDQENALPTPFYDDIASVLADCPMGSTVELAFQEVKRLVSFSVGTVLEEPVLRSLQRSATVLIKFVTTLPDLFLSQETREGAIFVFSAIMTSAYLDRLLTLRTVIRRLVVQSMASTRHATTVAIWVDELLWQLSLVIPQIAAGFLDLEEEKEEILRRPRSIQDQMRNEGLRSVVQLPESWKDIHLVLGSPAYSPASKRVALSLLFGSYVMAPQFSGQDTSRPNCECHIMVPSLHGAANELHCALHEGVSSTADITCKRSGAAMLVGLFATLASSEHRDGSLEPSQLLPQRYGCLLELIIIVLGPESDTFYPLEKLDAPQRILVMWGNTIPWAWSTWTDQRVANVEHLRHLTATWLCRMDDPLFEGCSFNPLNLSDNLRQALMMDIPNSSLMVQLLLRDIKDYLDKAERSGSRPPPDLCKLLGKVLWALIQYLEHHVVENSWTIQSRTPDILHCTLLIFSHLSLSVEQDLDPAKKLVLEALSLIEVDVFTKSLEVLLSQKSCQFMERLQKAATRACAKQLDGRNGDFTALDPDATAAHSLLSFLTILLLKDVSQTFELQEIVGTCLESVFKYAVKGTSLTPNAKRVRHALLTTLCACTIAKAKRLIPCSKDDIWLLALHTGKHDIMMTGAFANYVLLMKTPLDVLLIIEAWDHFSAALVTLIDQQMPLEEASIALLTVPALCQALKKLFAISNPETKRLLGSSLRTLNLQKALNDLMGSEPATQGPYVVSLKERLGNMDAFIEAATEEMNNTSELLDIAASNPVQYGHKLLYYRGCPYEGLTIVHDAALD